MAWNWYPAIKEGTDTAKSPPRLHAHADMDVRAPLAAHDGLAPLLLAMSLRAAGAYNLLTLHQACAQL